MAACFVNAHSIMDTPHFSGDMVHGALNRNDKPTKKAFWTNISPGLIIRIILVSAYI